MITFHEIAMIVSNSDGCSPLLFQLLLLNNDEDNNNNNDDDDDAVLLVIMVLMISMNTNDKNTRRDKMISLSKTHPLTTCALPTSICPYRINRKQNNSLVQA